jgi:hypothetical protein
MGAEGERVEASLRRIDELVSDLDRIADPVARERSRTLLQTVLDLHGLALARILALAALTPRGGELLERLGKDPVARPVLLLYGLHPEDLETRMRQAAAGLGPALARHGANVEIGVRSARRALVRIAGSRAALEAVEDLRGDIEAALLEAAPELESIDFEPVDVEVLEQSRSLPAAG